MWISTVFTEMSGPLLGTNTTPTVPLHPAQVLRTSINKVQILATESSCHERDTDYVLPYCLEVLQFLLFFQ